MIYFDNAATTRILPEVIEEMNKSFEEHWGNPSSTHRQGQKSRAAIEKSREAIAKLLQVDAKEIIFTSGGAESNNLILKGALKVNETKGKHLITSKIEHSTVLRTCQALEKEGYEVTYIEVTERGVIDLEQLKNAIRNDTVVISVMYVNNETGVVQPIDEIAKMIEGKGIVLHTDAIQGVGKEMILPKKQGIHALSAAAHKFYGPKGTGFLYLDQNYMIEKEITGGSQERNRRSGTENVHGIVGMAKAFEIVYSDMEEEQAKEKEMQIYLEEALKKEICNIKINCGNSRRISSVVNITLEDCNVQTLMVALDMEGICVSGGSACMSGAMETSHVLKAMGASEEDLKSSIRVSIGRYNTKDEIDIFIQKLKEIVARERAK